MPRECEAIAHSIDSEPTRRLLSAVSRAQSQFIEDVDPHILFDELQRELLSLTDSEYGFIGEVLHRQDGRPFLKTHAISDIAWNDQTREFYEAHAPTGLEFDNMQTLFGKVLLSGNPVVSNSPATDPRGGGLPPDHPPLKSFLGLPFFGGQKLVGMIGMANRPEGYDEALVEYLQPILSACGGIINAYRNELRRSQMEKELAEARGRLELRVQQRTAELTEANARLRFQAKLLDSVRESIVASDLDERITYWGKGAERLYGYATEEALGKPAAELVGAMTEPERKARRKRIEHTGAWQGECQQRTKAGATVWTDTWISIVTDAGGRPQGFVGVDRDISERKRVEEDLCRRCKDLTNIARLRTIGEVATILAHEINQPLQAISNYANGASLRMRQNTLCAEDVPQAFQVIAEQAERAGEIVRRLRRHTSVRESQPNRLELIECMENAIGLIQFELDRQGVKLLVRCSPELPHVYADKIEIEQVILQLIRNSMEAMSETPIQDRRIVIVASLSSECRLRVCVADRGKGIDQSVLETIFDPFYTTKANGLGMGLAIVQTIIESHAGRVWAESNIKSGARMNFELPTM